MLRKTPVGTKCPGAPLSCLVECVGSLGPDARCGSLVYVASVLGMRAVSCEVAGEIRSLEEDVCGRVYGGSAVGRVGAYTLFLDTLP